MLSSIDAYYILIVRWQVIIYNLDFGGRGFYEKKFFIWTLKTVTAILSFSLIFNAIQYFLMPRFIEESTSIVQAYNTMEKDSIDVLFLGASQMYCTVDSGLITRKYGIDSVNYGAAAQRFTSTEYYFDQALKSQSPKIVMVEVAMVFSEDKIISEDKIAWSYSPMPPSWDKYISLQKVLLGDKYKAFEYAFTPLFIYHNRWKSIKKSEIKYIMSPAPWLNPIIESRGFVQRHQQISLPISYLHNEETMREIPQESKNAILNMKNKCNSQGVTIIFFKSLNSSWSKGYSNSVKQFMIENRIEYIDLHDYIVDIGIDAKTDFDDVDHLNVFGAEKVTTFLAKYLEKKLK